MVAVSDQPLPDFVTARLASWTRWNTSTLTAAFGSVSVMAFLNASDWSIATASTRFRQAAVRAFSQPPTAAESRPSTMPRSLPLSALTVVDIHGSTRRHRP